VTGRGQDGKGRGGETLLALDPATRPDATLVFIGRVRSGWRPGDCPHNLTEARARGGSAALEIDAAFRAGLDGLSAGDPVIVVTFLDVARRDLIRLAPRHRTVPLGAFALRSPARPNPIGLAVTRITALDAETGRVEIEAIDVFDGTPLIDLKPWIAAVDTPQNPPPGEGLATRGPSG
jgi:tRNA-Thr(GGU) m(6)t(6)A37 methyltransferase TsaA